MPGRDRQRQRSPETPVDLDQYPAVRRGIDPEFGLHDAGIIQRLGQAGTWRPPAGDRALPTGGTSCRRHGAAHAPAHAGTRRAHLPLDATTSTPTPRPEKFAWTSSGPCKHLGYRLGQPRRVVELPDHPLAACRAGHVEGGKRLQDQRQLPAGPDRGDILDRLDPHPGRRRDIERRGEPVGFALVETGHESAVAQSIEAAVAGQFIGVELKRDDRRIAARYHQIVALLARQGRSARAARRARPSGRPDRRRDIQERRT